MNGFALKRTGFTLIELIVVIALLGILAGVVLPRLHWQRDLKADFISELNYLTQLTRQNALLSGKVHRIIFDNKMGQVSAEEAKPERVHGALEFQPVLDSKLYLKTKFKWIPSEFAIQDFFVGNHNEAHGGQLNTVWFLLFPDGLLQPIIINFVGQEEFSLVLNPFMAQFKEYETFQYPNQ